MKISSWGPACGYEISPTRLLYILRLSCEKFENLAAYEDLDTIIDLVGLNLDDVEEDIKYCKPNTDLYYELCKRRIRVEEVFDRLVDLQEMVDIGEVKNGSRM